MSKAIIEMPNSCADCPCNDDEYSVCRLDKDYRYNTRFVFNREKPNWCPLKPYKNSITIEWIEKYKRVRGWEVTVTTQNAIDNMLNAWEKENDKGSE